MRQEYTGETVLNVTTIFEKASTGGGCAKFEIENMSSKPCDVYEVELNIRPSWGTLSERDGYPIVHGVSLLDIDEDAGALLVAVRNIESENSVYLCKDRRKEMPQRYLRNVQVGSIYNPTIERLMERTPFSAPEHV